MQTLIAFVTIPSAVDNNPNDVSLIGEISPRGLSFSRDRGEYSNSTLPSVRLTTFTSEDELGNKITPSVSTIDAILALGDWVAEVGLGVAATTDIAIWDDNFELSIESGRLTLATTNIVFNEIAVDNNRYVPTSLTYTSGDIEVQLFFTDSAFKSDYPRFETLVVDPVEELNDLFRPLSEISDIVFATLSDVISRVGFIAGNSPYTELTHSSIRRVDPETGDSHFLDWPVAIYGTFGNNPIDIQNAIREHILANSDFNALEWFTILPDLFRPTEFTLVPQWDRVAISDFNNSPIFYSPVITTQQRSVMQSLVKQFIAPAHVDTYTSTLQSTYKNVAMISVSGDTNTVLFNITDVFPDYIEVSLNSADHNRTSIETQGWGELIEDMLRVAETINQFSDIPDQYSTIRRGEIDYLVTSYNAVNYLVAIKFSYLDFLAEE